MDELQARLSDSLGRVLMFTKEGCPFCIKAKDLLLGIGVEPLLEVIDDNTKTDIRNALAEISNGDNRLPRIFIGGKHLGGFNELESSLKDGKLFGFLLSANVVLKNDLPNIIPTKVANYRTSMTPDAYVEESLMLRNIIKSTGPLELPDEIQNLYSLDPDGTFKFVYTECNKPYANKPDDTCQRIRDQESERCEKTANVVFHLDPVKKSKFKLNLVLENTYIWGMRFVARINVQHVSGETSTIYLPGVLTFDPAGITGDSHSSERIGPSCARIQTGITIAQLFALQKGCTSEDVDAIQDASGEVIYWFNGRLAQWKWMRHQVKEACEEKKAEVTPYPEFIKLLIKNGDLVLDHDNRAVTKEYLKSWELDAPTPPMQYFIKVNESNCSCFL